MKKIINEKENKIDKDESELKQLTEDEIKKYVIIWKKFLKVE